MVFGDFWFLSDAVVVYLWKEFRTEAKERWKTSVKIGSLSKSTAEWIARRAMINWIGNSEPNRLLKLVGPGVHKRKAFHYIRVGSVCFRLHNLMMDGKIPDLQMSESSRWDRGFFYRTRKWWFFIWSDSPKTDKNNHLQIKMQETNAAVVKSCRNCAFIVDQL